jgi:DNA-binding NarL/FixJ family response regulator
VAVIENNELVRRGQCSAFSEADDFELVTCASLDASVCWTTEWSGIDLVVLDPFDCHQVFDRFAGVSVVEAIRAQRLDPGPLVLVVSGVADNPYLIARMAEAGADFLYHRTSLEDARSLRYAARHPDPGPLAAPAEITCSRVVRSLNTLLAQLQAEGLEEVFAPGLSQAETGLSRRANIRIRHLVADLGGLEALPARQTGGPSRRGVVPTWREVVHFVNRARGFELRFPRSERRSR